MIDENLTDDKPSFAVRIHDLGYNLIPISGKHPPCIPWTPWKTERVTREQMLAWKDDGFFSEKNGRSWKPKLFNWGLLAGAKPYSDAPALIVVDTDDEASEKLWLEHAPETPVRQITGRVGGTGRQRVYRRPAGVAYIGNRQKTWHNGVQYNLDVRGDGGYVVAPGSVHPISGNKYREVEPWTAELIASAPVYDPTWLACDGQPIEEVNYEEYLDALGGDRVQHVRDENFLEACTAIELPTPERVAQAKRYLQAVPGTQVGSGADNRCFSLTMAVLKGFALTPDDAQELLCEWGRRDDQLDAAGGYEPWDQKMIAHKVADGLKTPYKGMIGDKLRMPLPDPATVTVEIDLTTLQATPPKAERAGDPEVKHGADDFIKMAVEKEAVKVQAAADRAYKFRPLSSSAFAKTRYSMEWLIKGVLVKNQPTIIGGPKKSLKTNLLTDMCLSIGSGTPFLGQFDTRKSRVAFISGESGEYTLQETANRICAAKGIRLEDVDVLWDFRLPRLSVEEELRELSQGLSAHGVEFVVVDPLYLCLLSGSEGKSASNLFDMGPLLMEVGRACLDAGATPALVQHSKKFSAAAKGSPYDPLDLEDLAFSGVQEFARQWLLLNRRAKYEPGSGHHELWMQTGGSVGHGGIWALDIEEGAMKEDFTGRTWDIDILNMDEVKEKKNEEREHKATVALDDLAGLMMKKLDACETPPAKTQLRDKLAWNSQKFNKVLTKLLDDKVLALVDGEIEVGNGARRKTKLIVRGT